MFWKLQIRRVSETKTNEEKQRKENFNQMKHESVFGMQKGNLTGTNVSQNICHMIVEYR